MSTIVVIGCGGIGFRHAQAAVAAHGVTRVAIVEPNAKRLEAVMTELAPGSAASLHPFARIEDARSGLDHADIAIAAITADVQAALMDNILGLGAGTYLFEKPFAQSAATLDSLLGRIERHSRTTAVYVNCSRNMWSPYAGERDLQGSAPDGTALHMEVFGPLWGFGCNAVHFLELLRFITGAKTILCETAQLENSPHGNKRGPQFEEFIGTASFRTERGDTLQLTSAGDPAQPAGINVIMRRSTPGSGSFVDEDLGIVHNLAAGTRRAFTPLFVSASTKPFIEAVLQGRAGELPLPSVSEAAIAHRALFQALGKATGRHHFNIT